MEYHLAKDGKDSNDGKARFTAWGTKEYALSKLIVGDILYVYDNLVVPPQLDMISILTMPSTLPPPPPSLAPLMLVPTKPTHGKTFNVVVGSGVSAATDWLAVFRLGGTKTQYLDWKYLNNTKNRPTTGIRPAIVTLLAPAAGDYELRFQAAGSILLGMVPFTVG